MVINNLPYIVMSNFQVPPPAPRRRRRAVVISEDLTWLSGLTRDMNVQLKRESNFKESFCADIDDCECCVCMEDTNRTDVRRFGCGHDTCNSCFTRIYATNPSCPLCRKHITHVMSLPKL